MAKDRDPGVYRLTERQFGQWKDGERITGPIAGSGCLMALAALPFTTLLALLRRRGT